MDVAESIAQYSFAPQAVARVDESRLAVTTGQCHVVGLSSFPRVHAFRLESFQAFLISVGIGLKSQYSGEENREGEILVAELRKAIAVSQRHDEIRKRKKARALSSCFSRGSPSHGCRTH